MLLNFIKNSILDFSCLYGGWYAKEAVDDFFFKTLNKKSKKKKKKKPKNLDNYFKSLILSKLKFTYLQAISR